MSIINELLIYLQSDIRGTRAKVLSSLIFERRLLLFQEWFQEW